MENTKYVRSNSLYVGTKVEKRKLNLPKLPKFMRFFLRPFIQLHHPRREYLTCLRKRKLPAQLVRKVFSARFRGATPRPAIGRPGETQLQAPLNPGYAERTKLPGVMNGSTSNLPPNSAIRVQPASGLRHSGRAERREPHTAELLPANLCKRRHRTRLGHLCCRPPPWWPPDSRVSSSKLTCP